MVRAMHQNIVGPRMREARKQAKPRITQEELAARLQVMGSNLTQSAISKIEQQRRPVYDFEVLPLARALGTSVAWLLGEVDTGSGASAPSSRPHS